MQRNNTAAAGFQPQKILFPDGIHTVHLGKNGSWLCSGLLLTYEKGVEPTFENGNRRFPESLRITPITSKGTEGKCHAELPMSEIPRLTRALRQIFRQHNSLAKCRKQTPKEPS